VEPKIARAGTSNRLSWPPEFTNAVPKIAASFPAAWSLVTNRAAFAGSNSLLVLLPPVAPAYYHLRLP